MGTLSSARIAVGLGVRSWTHSLRSGQGARTTLRTKNHLMHPASQIQREKAKAQRFGTQNYRTPHQDAPQTDILRTEILSVRLRRSTMTPRPLELDVCTGPRTGMRTEIAGGGVMELGSWMGKALWDPLRCYRVTALSKGTLSATLPICTSGFEPHRCANGIGNPALRWQVGKFHACCGTASEAIRCRCWNLQRRSMPLWREGARVRGFHSSAHAALGDPPL